MYSATGQECEGSLGDNLFTAGDFGSGTDYAIATDPGLAPGYFYDRFGPPDDGEYIITNDVGRWPFVFGTWLIIQDPSPDPQGYMMVVNASFEPGLFYEEIISDLCEDTEFEFSADILNMIQRQVTDHILPNVEFLIDDVVVLRTGDIPQDELWHRYSFSFRTEPGQTSLKLSLRNNAPGGIGNDLALDNITFRACGPPGEVFNAAGDIICQEDVPAELVALLDGEEITDGFYQWERTPAGQNNWSVIPGQDGSRLVLEDQTPGKFWYRFATSASPASFDNIKCRFYSSQGLIEISQREFMVFDTICGGTDIPFGTDVIGTPGLYVRELTSSQGCDSIVLYHLDTVRRATLTGDLRLVDPLCPGQATGIVEGVVPGGGYAPYHIEIDDIRYDGLLANDIAAGSGSALIADKFGCFAEFFYNIDDPPDFIIDLGPDLEILLGEEVSVKAISSQEIFSIEWESPLESYQEQSIFTFLPIENVKVAAMAFNENDCPAMDAFFVSVSKDVRIYIPNIFSPNEDGINDTFVIGAFGRSVDMIREMQVFDRWGNVVWNVLDADPSFGWDGKGQDGLNVLPGVYTYVLTAILINGEKVSRTGTVTVIY